jgi:hypothetical protein
MSSDDKEVRRFLVFMEITNKWLEHYPRRYRCEPVETEDESKAEEMAKDQLPIDMADPKVLDVMEIPADGQFYDEGKSQTLAVNLFWETLVKESNPSSSHQRALREWVKDIFSAGARVGRNLQREREN